MRLLITSLALSATNLLFAQQETPTPASSEEKKPLLTPDQKKNVLKQLDDLETTIMQKRGTDLSAILQRIRSAVSSDAAAINFVAECDKLVNVERKDGDRKDAKRIEDRKEQEKRGESKKEEAKDGDHATGLRLCLEYLALSLEAHEAKDINAMIPKVLAFHQTMLGQVKKLKGRTGDMLMRPVSSRSANGENQGGRQGQRDREVGIVVQAYSLEPFLRNDNWPMEPGNIIEMYDRLILKQVREKKPADLGAMWDQAITNEGLFRKGRMTDGEFALWQQQDYPQLRWRRAQDLAAKGSNPVLGMADMLNVIKEFPNNPHSPEWIRTLRMMVAPETMAPKSDDEKTTAP